MNKNADLRQSDLIAREPKQARGRVKVERILAASEALILEHGADGFSSPMVADAAEIPVASVYQFFPTKYAIIRTLAERQMALWTAEVLATIDSSEAASWQEAIGNIVDTTVNFGNNNPLFMELLLRAPVRSEAVNVTGDTGSALLDKISLVIGAGQNASKIAKLVPAGLDPASIVIDISQAVLAAGYRAEGKLSPYTLEETKRVAIAYLEMYAEG